MIRDALFPTLAAAFSLVLLSGCAGPQVRVNLGKIDEPLEQVTGMTSDDVQKAGQKTSLNLWDVYALAVEGTEGLAANYENIEQAHAQSQEAVGAWLPQISLGDTKNWQSNDYIVGAPNPLFNPIDNSLYLSGAETIFSGLTQVAAVQGAQAAIDFADDNLKNGAATLLLGVSQAFYNVLQLQDALDAQKAFKDLNEKTLEQEKSWQAIGRSRKSDVLSTQAQLDQVTATLASTRDQLIQARETLANLAHIKPDAALQSDDENFAAPPYTLDEALAKVENRPDVKSAAASVQIAGAFLLQAHGQHLPTLTAEGRYYLQEDGGSPTPNWNFQLVASLPLFEGGQIFAQERSAESKKRQAELQLSLVRRNGIENIRQAYQSLVDSIQEMQAFQTALDSAQLAYQEVLHDYRLSLTTNLEVLQSLNTLESTKESYVKARYQVLAGQVALGIATGDLPKIVKDRQN